MPHARRSPATIMIAWLAALLAAGPGSAAGPRRSPGPGPIRVRLRVRPLPAVPRLDDRRDRPRPRRRLVRRHRGEAPDVGIWVARHDGKAWSTPVEVARGEQDGTRLPCWNPVLFQPEAARCCSSTRSAPTRATGGACSRPPTTAARPGRPRRAPRRLPRPDQEQADRACPAARSSALPARRRRPAWRVHFERSTDLGRTWKRIGPVDGETVRRHPAEPPDPPRRQAPGALPEPAGPDRRELVGRRRQDLGRAGRHRPAQPQRGDRRRDPGRRPAAARLQPHRRRAAARSTSRSPPTARPGRRRWCWRTSRANTPTPPSSRRPTAWSTSPTPGTAGGSSTSSSTRRSWPSGTSREAAAPAGRTRRSGPDSRASGPRRRAARAPWNRGRTG